MIRSHLFHLLSRDRTLNLIALLIHGSATAEKESCVGFSFGVLGRHEPLATTRLESFATTQLPGAVAHPAMQSSAWRRRPAEHTEPGPAATLQPPTRRSKGAGAAAQQNKSADWNTYIGQMFADG